MSSNLAPGDIKRVVTLWTKMHRINEAIDRVKADIKLSKQVSTDISLAKKAIEVAINGLSSVAFTGISKYQDKEA
jgi:hypothetical protein